MKSFSARIQIIGVNPYVLLPASVLKSIFGQSGKNKSPIQVHGTLNGNKFIQTLVKFKGKWRLYLNTPMREKAGIDVGDMANVKIEYDPEPRILLMHPKLAKTLANNKQAKTAFEKLAPYRKKEIIRYIGFMKSEESLNRNIIKVVNHLRGKGRFAGRD